MKELLKSLVRPLLRIKGGYETAWTILAMCGHCPPYHSSWEDARTELKRVEAEGNLSPLNGYSVLLYTHLEWAHFVVSLASVLAGLGYRVDILFVPHFPTRRSATHRDQRFIEWSRRRDVQPIHERINVIDLGTVE